MFYTLAIGSMLGYALQSVLLVRYARKIDGLSLAFYRNISFAVTLAPLLIGASYQEITSVLSYWKLLMYSGFAGGVYLSMLFASYRYLSMSFASTILIATSTVLMAWFGWVFFGEVLSFTGIALIGLILIGVLVFGMTYNHPKHLDQRFALGILLIAISAIPVAYAKYIVTFISRETNPLVSGYFWEVSIGIACALLILLRWLCLGKKVQRVSAKEFGMIALCTSPTLIGTGLYSLAVANGPIAIVGAIGSAGIVATSMAAWVLYGEKLKSFQWIAVALIVAGIVGLKFFH